jgi:hypothetical protein
MAARVTLDDLVEVRLLPPELKSNQLDLNPVDNPAHPFIDSAPT